MSVYLVRLDEVAAQPWRNGGGMTRELRAGPDQGDWQWRVSVADIERDGPFSSFPGVQRWFVPIAGAGVELRIDGQAHVLTLGMCPLAFDGAAVTTCHLLDGPTRDLNLMLRGAAGGMRRAIDGVAWAPAGLHCGLFATTAGICQEGEQAITEVPDGSLLWWDKPPSQLRFTASARPCAAPGWWLFAKPHGAQA
jgi:environmental stress-induced protein Ves